MNRQNTINAFHRGLLGDGAPSFKIAGWGSPQSQNERFLALLRTARFTGGSVVDFGCGPGDLLAFLRGQDFSFDYLGLDQSPEMIALARRLQGDYFRLIAFDEISFDPADYVFASGVFQFNGGGDHSYVAPLLAELFSRCRKALVINVLSTMRLDSEKSASELYIHPKTAVEIATSITSFWCMDHSYHPGAGDMAIAMHRRNPDTNWRRP